MSLSGDDEAELRGYWDKLREGGTEMMPLEKAPWGDTFGMLRDKYGIDWLVNITAGELRKAVAARDGRRLMTRIRTTHTGSLPRPQRAGGDDRRA